MNPFGKSLRFKLTLLVIGVELVTLTGLGVFYSHRFSEEIDNAIIARLSIPALLMTRGELSFEAVSDQRTMEGILREPYSEGIVIGLDGQVYYASDPALLDRHLDEIDGIRLPGPEASVISSDAPDLIAPFQDSTGTYLTCLSPLSPDGKLTGYLYLKVGTAISEAEKRKVSLLFAIGSLGTIALTAAILSWLLHLTVIRRLNDLVEIFRRFALGDYAARSLSLGGEDEIATLMNGFNGLAKRLEDTVAHLRESETLLNTTQRLSKVGGWEYDVKSGKSYWTEELYRIHEIPCDPGIDLVKQSLVCYGPEQRQILDDAFQRACEQGLSYDLELPFATCKGKPLWIRTTAQPVYEDGKVVRLVGNLMDITKRKRAEEALRLSSERLQLATRVAKIGIWDWDIPKNELMWDDSMYQLYGIRKGDFGGAYDAWIRTLHPEDKAYTDGEIQAALSGKREYAPEFRIVRPDGTIRHIKADSRTILDLDGKPRRMIGTNIDITERKQAEDELRRLMRFQQTILNSAAYSIISATPDGIITGFNPAAERLLGYSTDELIGKQTPALWHDPQEVEQHARRLSEQLGEKIQPGFDVFTARPKRNLIEENEWIFIRKDGTRVPVNLSVTALRDGEDRIIGYVGLIYDLTERKRAEDELRCYQDQLEETVERRTAELQLARNAAEAANKAKSVFLANMSHELRTPMNAILGFSNMMRRDPQLTESQRENLAIINRSGEHLLSLINDVLEVAKIEAGRLQLEITAFDLGGLVRDIIEMIQIRAQEKGLRLLLDQSSEFPRYIKGDEARIRQIMINLISNAVKFTDQGGVTVRLGLKDNACHHLLIEVEDSGPGIAPEDQHRLFEPFVQLTEGDAQRGTGLGLTITRQFVQMMGGNIAVESTPGKGALFRVDLPLALASPSELLGTEIRTSGEVIGLEPGQPRYRIMIVEDQRENQLLLSRLMADIGLEVKVVENGQQCLETFPDWRPDLIWMDRRMPVMDGIEATKWLRRLPEGQTVKIIAVTASAFKEQQQEMLDAGMDDFIRKPYRCDEIYDCLARQLRVKYIYRASEEAADTQSFGMTPAMLSGLPTALRNQLKEALKSLDSERIALVIHQIGEIDVVLARALSSLADGFDYPSILAALDSTSKKKADD